MDDKEKEIFFIPNLRNALDNSNPVQMFVGVSKSAYDEIKITKQGMNFDQSDTHILYKSLMKHHLIHTSKVLSSSKVTNFNGFTTIFAGLGSHSIDDSFQELSPPGSDITIHLNFVKASEFHN